MPVTDRFSPVSPNDMLLFRIFLDDLRNPSEEVIDSIHLYVTRVANVLKAKAPPQEQESRIVFYQAFRSVIELTHSFPNTGDTEESYRLTECALDMMFHKQSLDRSDKNFLLNLIGTKITLVEKYPFLMLPSESRVFRNQIKGFYLRTKSLKVLGLWQRFVCSYARYMQGKESFEARDTDAMLDKLNKIDPELVEFFGKRYLTPQALFTIRMRRTNGH